MIERRPSPTPETFLAQYLVPHRPVVLTDAMDGWQARTTWTPAVFRERFGAKLVQVYDDLFKLTSLTSLAQYLDRYFGAPPDAPRPSGPVPYVRWYTRLKAIDRFPWADEIFRQLHEEWSLPPFLPEDGYLMPFCPPGRRISPNTTPFPARGLFISARGCCTRLHKDPWQSDAVLCQLHGRKRFVLYEPTQAPFLTQGTEVVDIDAPDLERFPRFPEARPFADFELSPGEVLLIPQGWYHQADTLSDSISLTWNFVHQATWPDFARYLASDPPRTELDTITYFSGPHES